MECYSLESVGGLHARESPKIRTKWVSPFIRGLRIPVATVVGMVADGMTESEILGAYSDLQAADIQEALQYAAEAVRERDLPLAAQ